MLICLTIRIYMVYHLICQEKTAFFNLHFQLAFLYVKLVIQLIYILNQINIMFFVAPI